MLNKRPRLEDDSRRNAFLRCIMLATLILSLPTAALAAPQNRPAHDVLSEKSTWLLGPFRKMDNQNPVLQAEEGSTFLCPMRKRTVHWEAGSVFNPAAIVRGRRIYLFYRAEDTTGTGIGGHTSRIGLATSDDGLHFTRMGSPVLFPDEDGQKTLEWDGGCEDPRIVETEEGTYILTYTQWDRTCARLAIATSNDLRHWKKEGYAFAGSNGGRFKNQWSKSGSIVCRRSADRLIATKIHGSYWMYWGEKNIYLATSSDLIHWEPVLDKNGNLAYAFGPRSGKFDSDLVEPGPPAIVTGRGILFLYNGKNSTTNGDTSLRAGTYAAGQALLDLDNPARLVARCATYFMKPERPYEVKGQYSAGTVFMEGLVHFNGRWFLYYGAADSRVAVASSGSMKTTGIPKPVR